MIDKDYYDVVGVARNASLDDIKRAYRQRARKYHPDMHQEPNDVRFKELGEAYAVLKDKEKRAHYDQFGHSELHQSRAGAPASSRPFNERQRQSEANQTDGMDQRELFEAIFGRHRQSYPGADGAAEADNWQARGADIHAPISIPLIDAYHSAEHHFTLPLPVLDQQGKVSTVVRHLKVHIPKGIFPGQHLRLSGQGEPSQYGGMPGDLYLEIEFAADPYFRVDKIHRGDIYLDLPLSPWEAALGCRMTLPTPAGLIELTIPAESSAGKTLRVKGKGIPGKKVGDLLVVLNIALPPAQTATAQAAYVEMAKAFDFNPRQYLEAHRL